MTQDRLEPTNPEQAILKSILAQLEASAIGAALSHGGLTIFPLTAPDGHEPAYELLEDALASGTAVISEVSEGGSVPELLLDNKGERPAESLKPNMINFLSVAIIGLETLV